MISASCGPVLYEVQGLRQKRIMHHDRLKPYDCEVIPARVRRQRSEILQKSKDTPDNPIMQEPLHEPEPPASQGSSETESISSDPEPQENQDKERKWQPAARRRRKKLGLGLMSDIGGQETIKRTQRKRNSEAGKIQQLVFTIAYTVHYVQFLSSLLDYYCFLCTEGTQYC